MDQASPNNIVLKISNLKKSFGNFHILTGADLELIEKHNLVILGHSGTGKSVLFKCIVRLIEPDSGNINVLGENILGLEDEDLTELRVKIGYVFQGGALYDSMSVRANLEFPLKYTRGTKRSQSELNDLVEEALVNVGLIESIDKMPSELSGGMMKRIGLARTLILKPRILLYDEPTTGLDPVTSGEISELILKVQENYNTSSLIISHDIKCIEITANQVYVLKEGKFTANGSLDEMKHHTDPFVNSFFK
jgi:phospholipid/cholesterol/gamma-HCH transport system ATP-binding protein